MKKKPKHSNKMKLFLLHGIIILVSILLLYSLQQPEKVTVEATVLNVRTKPNQNAEIIQQIDSGQQLTVIESRNKWYQVQLSNGRRGWIASWLVKDRTKGKKINTTAFVISRQAILYEDCFKESNQIKTLKRGTEVKMIERHDNWRLVEVNHIRGWIPASDLTVGTSPEMAQTELKPTKESLPHQRYVRQKDVQLRSKPNADSTPVTQLDMGDKLTILDKTSEWYHVKTDFDDEGYIASWLTTDKNLSKTSKRVNRLSKATIVIDPGHGGQDAGSISADNRYEKDASLQTSKVLAQKLKAHGAKVILTRSDDEYVGLEERAQISNRNKADAFICIHFDSTAKANVASGTTTYYYHDNSKRLADDLNQEIAKLPLQNRGVEFGDHQVTRDNNQPAVLLELGYMSTEKDVQLIFSKTYQNQIANAIVEGLQHYFDDSKKS